MQFPVSVRSVQGGLWASRFATLAAPFVIFLALPPFYNGIWVQVEGAMPWLHGVSALAAFGCAMMAWQGDARAGAVLIKPLVLIPAAIFALAVILLPATTIPAMSLLGAPEHGFGALVYLDLAALTAAAFVSCADAIWRRVAICAAFCAVGGAFVLDAVFRADRTWAPFFFGDYLAFYAIFVFAIVGVLARGRRLVFAAGMLACLVLSVLSSSKTMFLAIAGASLFLPVIWRDNRVRTGMFLSVVFPIAIGIAVVLIGSAWAEANRPWLLRLSGYGPVPGLIADSWASMWSRAMLVVVGAQSLLDEPWRFLVGLGWGHFNEALLANLPTVDGRLHEFIGPSAVYWDAIRRVDFHSHNQYFEALLSSGVLGAVLVLAYGAALVAAVPIHHRRLTVFVVLMLATLQSFWFQMPHTIPVMALAFALLAGDGALSVPATPGLRRLVPLCAMAAAGILLCAAAIAGIASTNVRLAQGQIDRIVKSDDGSSIQWRFMAGLEEIYDATLVQRIYALMKDAPDGPALEVLHTYLAHDLAGNGPNSLRLGISTVNTLSGIAFSLPEFEQRFGSQEVEFKRSVERLIRRAPRRSDIAIPYFNYLLSRGREAEVLALANVILARHENDAVGLWFSGIVLLGSEATSATGMRKLRESLIFGIRNLMPVDEAIVQAIQQ